MYGPTGLGQERFEFTAPQPTVPSEISLYDVAGDIPSPNISPYISAPTTPLFQPTLAVAGSDPEWLRSLKRNQSWVLAAGAGLLALAFLRK